MKNAHGPTAKQRLHTPGVIVLAYALFSAAWIAGSDRLLSLVLQDPEQFERMGTLKGMLFIAVTAALLYLLLKAWHRSLTEAIGTSVQDRERLRQAAAVFETTLEGVVVTDCRHRIVMVNRAFCEITGYTETEVVGMSPRLLRSERHPPDFYREMSTSIDIHGHWRGEIWNRRKNGEVYPQLLSISAVKDDAGAVINYVGVFADISRLKESESRLEFLAHHDPLTQLPNRLLLLSRLEHAISAAQRDNARLAVLMLDLDRFKDVNDSFGHGAGDELLRQVAERLASRLRGADTVARLGGDEFTVMLERIAHPEDAALVANEIMASLNKPWTLSNGTDVHIGVSIGISMYPDHGSTTQQLMQHADAALYQAKHAGRGCFRYFA